MSFSPLVSQTTCRAGPPTLRRAIMRSTFMDFGFLILDLRFRTAIRRVPERSTPVFGEKSKIRNQKYYVFLIHPEDRIRIIFVPNLIDLFAAAIAHVQTVRTVDHDPIDFADVLIRVNYTLGNDDSLRRGLA